MKLSTYTWYSPFTYTSNLMNVNTLYLCAVNTFNIISDSKIVNYK